LAFFLAFRRGEVCFMTVSRQRRARNPEKDSSTFR
jgi:hypothetical protein